VTLDEWSDDEIDSMTEVGGNSSANAIYEAFLPEGVSKPGPDSSHEERMRFIRLEMTCLSNPNLSFFFFIFFFLTMCHLHGWIKSLLRQIRSCMVSPQESY
jgi:hypothetical protein